MSSENENLIKNILPRLRELGWDEQRMFYEVHCRAGWIDLLYKDQNDRPLVVLEVKKVGVGKQKALEQAISYAKSIKSPIAIAWDGGTFLDTFHVRSEETLQDYLGKPIGHNNYQHLTENNLLYFRGNNYSLKPKIKSISDMKAVYKKLNKLGKDIGLTSGMERVVEIAKIVFVKMLSDNNVKLAENDWNHIRGTSNPIRGVDHLLDEVEEDIKIAKLAIGKEKKQQVNKIVQVLDEVSFNHKYYDVAGTLFQEFLSERARGGSTNDLGQYFTPKKVVELIVSLSDFKNGNDIYDPYCGTGGILAEFFVKNNTGGGDKLRNFGGKCLYGSELSKPVSMLAKMNMVLAGDGHSNIEDIDSLSKENRYIQTNKQFDIVATNIPFAPSVPNDVPTGYFQLSATSSPVAKFIEHCINRCKRGGKIVLIVGKGFLTEKASESFRRNLLKTYCLDAVYQLYDGIFRPYTGSHSCLLVISKKAPETKIDYFSIKTDAEIDHVKEFGAGIGNFQSEGILSHPRSCFNI